ncbi:MAG TPA: M28 family peptidase [Thermoanaerobaculia bacterium]|nr:M28 family peptidase [Thermoanaerobaculia bacterium]
MLIIIALVWVVMQRRGDTTPVVATNSDRALAAELRRDVETLCVNGGRNVYARDALAAAEQFLARTLPERQAYVVDGVEVANLILEIRGAKKPDEIVVIGAHYDSVDDSPGADDNASGTAALLALARMQWKPARTLRFVAFVNEEPPHFQTHAMGSWQYARRCRARNEKVVAMLSLESIGYYDDREGSQQYPAPLAALHSNRGNFLGIASNVASRALTKRCEKAFRKHGRMPVESAVLPEAIPQIGWSDQWSFWQFGYAAVMVTDTAPFRNPHYHMRSDTPGTLDYIRLAIAVDSLQRVVTDLAQ